jgi:lysophospholipase L1-like esterase
MASMASRRSAAVSRPRTRLYLAVTLLTPLLVLGAAEGMLRVVWRGASLPLFGPATEGGGRLRVASGIVGRRYFPAERFAPSPPHDPFAKDKPKNAFRIFVMGESATAGFPYPHNGTFSRVLRDALHDVLPHDSVEVVNLGIAATNSYQLLDLLPEVLAEHPDAVLVYAGHNEYYGAFGVGSTVRTAGSPALVRAYLAAKHWRIPALLDRGVAAVRQRIAPPPATDVATASFMETVVADQDIRLDSPRFRAGERQFADNLSLLLARLRATGIPAFVGSLVSNERSQPPFAADGNAGPNGALAAWSEGNARLARGDTTGARTMLRRARDLDVVRFRAPSSFNAIIRRACDAQGATYVPVAEQFAATSPDSLPGSELLLEHVHPTRAGAVLMARVFYQALRSARFLGRQAQEQALAPWERYQERMALSPFDERIAAHTVASLRARWPFVRASQQGDYRATYRPVDARDSLALLVSRGGLPWEAAKVRRVEALIEAGKADEALMEVAGLLRDAPLQALPHELSGRALFVANREIEADSAFRQAWTLGGSVGSAYALGLLALRRKDGAEGIRWLLRAVQVEPTNAQALYQLSLAFAISGDAPRARATASRLAEVAPHFPNLAEWMQQLGLQPPR